MDKNKAMKLIAEINQAQIDRVEKVKRVTIEDLKQAKK